LIGSIKRSQQSKLHEAYGHRSVTPVATAIGTAVFGGWEPVLSYLIFEADMADEPALGLRHGERGVGKLDGGDRVRGVVTEQRLERDDRPTDEQLRAALIAAYESDFGVHNVTWLSRFTDAARQAASYRKGRVLLAGDAAHVHSPVGGQGLNIGLQDAVNLGWKLSRVVKGISPDGLLDTYHAERHPAGAALLKHILALTALSRGDDRTKALRELMAETMQMDEPRKWYAAMMSDLDIRYELGAYDFGGDHPLLGRRMPDLDIVTTDGPIRVFTLLHDARPVLLNFGNQARLPSEDGQIASNRSMRDLMAYASSPSSVRSRPRPPF
jgi:3-(3-hydroxy-phenyl)propionate hydroxylase